MAKTLKLFLIGVALGIVSTMIRDWYVNTTPVFAINSCISEKTYREVIYQINNYNFNNNSYEVRVRLGTYWFQPKKPYLYFKHSRLFRKVTCPQENE